jgi:hypothetical protein
MEHIPYHDIFGPLLVEPSTWGGEAPNQFIKLTQKVRLFLRKANLHKAYRDSDIRCGILVVELAHPRCVPFLRQYREFLMKKMGNGPVLTILIMADPPFDENYNEVKQIAEHDGGMLCEVQPFRDQTTDIHTSLLKILTTIRKKHPDVFLKRTKNIVRLILIAIVSFGALVGLIFLMLWMDKLITNL